MEELKSKKKEAEWWWECAVGTWDSFEKVKKVEVEEELYLLEKWENEKGIAEERDGSLDGWGVEAGGFLWYSLGYVCLLTAVVREQ